MNNTRSKSLSNDYDLINQNKSIKNKMRQMLRISNPDMLNQSGINNINNLRYSSHDLNNNEKKSKQSSEISETLKNNQISILNTLLEENKDSKELIKYLK